MKIERRSFLRNVLLGVTGGGLLHCNLQPAPKMVPAGQLPPPFATPSATNPPRVVAQPPGAALQIPPGFEIKVFAEGLQTPRWMALGPNGDVFVAESHADRVTILRDTRGAGVSDQRFAFAGKLTQPFGMAFWKDYFYVANTNSVVRWPYQSGMTRAEGQPQTVVPNLPGYGYGQHWTRNIIFSPDGGKMYVSIGSQSNVSEEADARRASICEYNPDGSGFRIFANGLRNPIGLAFYPGTNTLWTVVNERDGLGDDLVPDYLTSVKENGFYGWPYSYLGSNPDPRQKGKHPDLVSRAIVPDLLLGSHVAALGLIFYTGRQFPNEYQGNAFIAYHGSWNRAKRTGYKVVRVRFQNGKPVGAPEDLVSGWMLGEEKKEVWGRPVGLLQLNDGSLLIADDGSQKIWRLAHRGK